jgi:hypothetical protein
MAKEPHPPGCSSAIRHADVDGRVLVGTRILVRGERDGGEQLGLAPEVYWILVPSFRESRWPRASQRFALFGFVNLSRFDPALCDDRLHKQAPHTQFSKHSNKLRTIICVNDVEVFRIAERPRRTSIAGFLLVGSIQDFERAAQEQFMIS